MIADSPTIYRDGFVEHGAPESAARPTRLDGWWGRAFKRCFDLAIAIPVLAAAMLVLLVAGVLIRLDSRGPVLFSQKRVGRSGRRFTMYKLRTMQANNDASEHVEYVAALIRGTAEKHNGIYKLDGDRRITRVGRVLRRLSIDELPQLWNVVKGDMSIIGPRPPLAREVELYDDWAWQRLHVKPGLSGLAQVSGRAALSWNETVRFDIEYWQSWTPATDFKILLATPRAVLSKRGAA